MLSAPVRTCVGCRSSGPATELVRLVLTPAGVAPSARSAGRGAWLHPRVECVRLAVKTRAFARAFKHNVNLSTADELLAAVAAAAQPRP